MKSLFRGIFSRSQPELTEGQLGSRGALDLQERDGIAFQGSLAAVRIDDVFQLFDYAALTGELELTTTDNSGCFFFKEGVLVFGLLESNQRKIGEILLESNLVTEKQLTDCLIIHKNAKQQKRLGHILMEQGYIQHDTLSASLAKQVKEAFFEVMQWRNGTFHFHLDRLPADEEIMLSERIDHLLLEGVIRIDKEDDVSPPS